MLANAIKTDKYFDPIEIAKHLENVEYILMAAPAPDHFYRTPIHFTIFLNTDEELPKEVKNAILEKFLEENRIGKAHELISQIMPVGFAQSSQETAMPMLLVKPEDQNNIPYALMHVMDFLADSDNFFEAKEKNLTGWSYSYN